MYRFLAGMVDLAEPMQQEMQAAAVLVEILEVEQAVLGQMGLTGLHPRQEQLAHKQVEVAQQALELLVPTQQVLERQAEDFHC
jgi:hypothetical protein